MFVIVLCLLLPIFFAVAGDWVDSLDRGTVKWIKLSVDNKCKMTKGLYQLVWMV